ncbi:hypothetical protein [Streptomyces sp. NPDC056600]|uniref:hypothetical protein n=1 Tax=Streptomyces sp. NPDC056600 TaxID=3345874 RepID=UPI0036ACBA78
MIEPMNTAWQQDESLVEGRRAQGELLGEGSGGRHGADEEAAVERGHADAAGDGAHAGVNALDS